MAFTFLVCPDSQLLLERAQEILPEGFRLLSFWGDEPIPERYWTCLTVPPLDEPGWGVLLRRANHAGAEVWKRLDSLLRHGRHGIHALFALEMEWERSKPNIPKPISGSKCWAAAQQRGWVWQTPGLSRSEALNRAIHQAHAAGKTISPATRSILHDHLPLKAAALGHEMEKVLLAAQDESIILPQHLEALTEVATWDTFSLLHNAFSPAKTQALWEQLRTDPAMTSGEATFLILTLLRREARILWQLAHGEHPQARMPAAVLQAKEALARRLGKPGIARIIETVAEAEASIKTGKLRPNHALEGVFLQLTAPVS
jgi:DNA polymerase-3 subunit delta